jgi:hypothetical protein
MRLIAILFVLVVTFCVNAQDTKSVQSYRPLTSIIKIDGQVCQADSYEEFTVLLSLVTTVNQLKRDRAEKKLTENQYAEKVAFLIGEAKVKGVNVN